MTSSARWYYTAEVVPFCSAIDTGVEAMPLFVRGWFKLQCARGAVVVGALALINLFSWSGYPWVMWPAGALMVIEVIRRSSVRSR